MRKPSFYFLNGSFFPVVIIFYTSLADNHSLNALILININCMYKIFKHIRENVELQRIKTVIIH